MTSYHFRLFGPSDRYIIGHFVQFEDDVQAQLYAEKLLARSGTVVVEVRSNGRLVHQVTKCAQSRSASTGRGRTAEWTKTRALQRARRCRDTLSTAIAHIEQKCDDGTIFGALVDYLASNSSIVSVEAALRRAGSPRYTTSVASRP
jgi:hypothetical protein